MAEFGLKKVLLVFALGFLIVGMYAQVTITKEYINGVYKVPCEVNGVKMKFVYDGEGACVSMSSEGAKMLYEGTYITDDDIIDEGKQVMDNSNFVDQTKILLKDIMIDKAHIKNVQAIVSKKQSDFLVIGKNVIQNICIETKDGSKLKIKLDDSTFSAKVKCAENQYLCKNYSSAVDQFKELYKYREGKLKISNVYQLAESCYNLKQYSDAKKYFIKLDGQEYNKDKVYAYLANIYVEEENFKEAESYLTKITKHDNYYYNAYKNYSWTKKKYLNSVKYFFLEIYDAYLIVRILFWICAVAVVSFVVILVISIFVGEENKDNNTQKQE